MICVEVFLPSVLLLVQQVVVYCPHPFLSPQWTWERTLRVVLFPGFALVLVFIPVDLGSDFGRGVLPFSLSLSGVNLDLGRDLGGCVLPFSFSVVG